MTRNVIRIEVSCCALRVRADAQTYRMERGGNTPGYHGNEITFIVFISWCQTSLT
jgi:hypothetical protein